MSAPLRLPRSRRPSRVPFALGLVVVLVVAACTGSVTPSPIAPTPGATPAPTATDAPATPTPSPSPSPEPSLEPTATPSPVAPTAPPLPTAGTWSRVSPGGEAPARREDHTWVVDPDAGTAWLFGGRSGSTLRGDLWAYDLASDTWSRIAPIGPSPAARFGHDATWVPGRGLVIFGGQAGPTTFFDDVWQFDPQALRWTKLAASGAVPKARYGSCADIGPDGRLWVSHGFTEDGTRFADTKAYDLDSGRWTDVTPTGSVPVARCLHSCWWTPDGRFVLYAGQTTGVEALGDLWVLTPGAGDTPGTWERASIERPPDRNLYALTRYRDTVIVAGGRGLGRTFLDDVYVVDPMTLAFTRLDVGAGGPGGRGGAALIDDPARGRLLLFGGKDGSGALADLWALTLR